MTNMDRTEARAKYTAARRRMAAFIASQCSAKLDDEAIIVNERIVVSGAVSECALVAAYMTEVLGLEGVEVDEPDVSDTDLADWTCVRIPEASLAAALAKLTAGARP
jgi:hypothetical protein